MGGAGILIAVAAAVLVNQMADLKKVIRSEYLKCAKDPVHFMRKYCYIQHPQRGRIQFNLYPFQDKVLTLWRDNPYSIVLKSRQLGISTLSAGYSLWLMTFHKVQLLSLLNIQTDSQPVDLIKKICRSCGPLFGATAFFSYIVALKLEL